LRAKFTNDLIKLFCSWGWAWKCI